ncbi:glucose-6-phosphate/phosphate translocator [Gracilaria domingensis]|nr:glucose-6-phosphate/phosphate translocator [Gracilaria domingensis]
MAVKQGQTAVVHSSPQQEKEHPAPTHDDPSNAEVAGVIAFNFFSSTGIVSANKLVYAAGFEYGASLTFIHFICTTLGLLLLARMGVFTPKRLDVRKALKLAVAGMGFVVFSNLSLQHNSIGFYQVMKHMTVVGVVIIEALVFRKYLPYSFLAALGTMCFGVLITGVTDFQVNTVGTLFALANILCTSFYQIWCGSLQKSLEANPLQLQLYIAPLSAISIIPLLPVFDNYSLTDPKSILHFVPTTALVYKILFTGALALCVNVSIFLLIGKTSAVTYNVVGNGKTAFLFCVDFFIFRRPFDAANVFGMSLTLCGVIWYTQLKLKARAEAEKAEKERSSTS